MSLLGKKLNEISPEDLELIKEAAGALARYGEKLEKALARLRAAEEMMNRFFWSSLHKEEGMIIYNDPPLGSPERAALSSLAEAIELYQKAHQQAERARYKYIVQREAVGFRNHKFADQLFPLPPKRRNLK